MFVGMKFFQKPGQHRLIKPHLLLLTCSRVLHVFAENMYTTARRRLLLLSVIAVTSAVVSDFGQNTPRRQIAPRPEASYDVL